MRRPYKLIRKGLGGDLISQSYTIDQNGVQIKEKYGTA